MSKDITLQESNDKCPLCRTGYLYPTTISSFVGLITQRVKFRCNNCNGLILKLFDSD